MTPALGWIIPGWRLERLWGQKCLSDGLEEVYENLRFQLSILVIPWEKPHLQAGKLCLNSIHLCSHPGSSFPGAQDAPWARCRCRAWDGGMNIPSASIPLCFPSSLQHPGAAQSEEGDFGRRVDQNPRHGAKSMARGCSNGALPVGAGCPVAPACPAPSSRCRLPFAPAGKEPGTAAKASVPPLGWCHSRFPCQEAIPGSN